MKQIITDKEIDTYYTQLNALCDKWELHWDIDFCDLKQNSVTKNFSYDFEKPTFVLKTYDDEEHGLLGYRILLYSPHREKRLLIGPEFEYYVKYYSDDEEFVDRSKDLEKILFILKKLVYHGALCIK